MLETYKLAVKVMEFYDNIDPYCCGSDEIENAIKGNVEILLSGSKDEIIEDLKLFDLEKRDYYYFDWISVISDLERYEVPEIWWKRTVA